MIKTNGRRTGEGPSAVIRRLAEAEFTQGRPDQPSQAEIARRLAVFEELRQKYPPPDPKPTWAEIQQEIDSLYSYLDEPIADAESRKRA